MTGVFVSVGESVTGGGYGSGVNVCVGVGVCVGGVGGVGVRVGGGVWVGVRVGGSVGVLVGATGVCVAVFAPEVCVMVGVKIAVRVGVKVNSVGVRVGGTILAVTVGGRPGRVGNSAWVGKKPPGKVGMGVTSATGVLSASIRPGMSAGLLRSPRASPISPTPTGGSMVACKSAL